MQKNLKAGAILKKIEIIIAVICTIFCIYGINTKVYSAETDISSTFKDENLKNAILELAKEATGDESKTTITTSDIEKIVEQPGGTSLRLANKGITDLSGIEVFANKDITWIFLDWNEISNLEPLQNFSKLTKISFSGNQVEDLTPLANIETLENITAINNKITTLEPLKKLESIKYLTLDGNNITNLNPIINWTNLTDISIQNNQITEIPNMSKLKNLKSANLSNNKIETLENLAQLPNVEKFQIDNNKLQNLQGIEQLSNLTILSCSNNQITDISALEQLKKLENLNLNKNQIQNIEQLQNNTNLKYLYLDNNYIFDFESLKNQANLQKYTIYNQNVVVEIKDKIIQNKVLIPLPDLYASLYDSSKFVYNKEAKTEVTGTNEYKIDADKKYIEINTQDLKNNGITVTVSNSENTILNYQITADTTAPKISGVAEGASYTEEITPLCDDDDIDEVILMKNNQEVTYTIGDVIKEAGNYILIVRDKAGNETKVRFEMQERVSTEEYKIDGQYIVGITDNTNLEVFKNKLNGNVDYNIYRNNNLIDTESILATGDELRTVGNKIFKIIINGDITKDGKTDIKDLVKLRKYLINAEQFDDLQEKAADVSFDSQISIKDLVQMRKIIISK